ncbi:MAG TPA: GAF domain-containing sensor histidine kinase [Myxococcota bacterium]|jgi:signal transduction histidine kinase|nr:GAF domain-containing sensor histidine kinase [Myxococcota bacterium]
MPADRPVEPPRPATPAVAAGGAPVSSGVAIVKRPADAPLPLARIGGSLQARATAAPADGDEAFNTLRVLYRIADVLCQTNDRDVALGGVLDIVKEAARADHASILLPSGTGGALVEAVGDASVSQTMVSDAVRDRMGVVVLQAQYDSRYQAAKSVTLHRLGSVLCAPLLRDGEPVLVLYLARSGAAEPFDAHDLDLAFAAGQQLVLAVARLDAQEQTLALAASLRARERLATAGQMAAGLMHEVRNIVGSSSGYVQLAVEAQGALAATLGDGAPPEVAAATAEVTDCLQRAQAGMETLLQICRSMLDLARRNSPEPRPVELYGVLRSALELSRAEYRRVASVTFEPAPPLPVLGDVAGLTQVFLNLLVNAAHAFDPVRFDTNRIALTVEDAGDGRVAVRVTDNARGISPEALARVFQPLFTTRADSGGTGLGLAISREVVESLGGDIQVESQLGAGTRFTVRLRRPDVQTSSPA